MLMNLLGGEVARLGHLRAMVRRSCLLHNPLSIGGPGRLKEVADETANFDPSIVLVIYLGFLMVVWPWKSMLLNLADAVGCGALACMLIAPCPAVATMTDSLADQVTYTTVIFWVIGIGVQVAFVCYSVACWYKQRMGGEAYKEAKLEQCLAYKGAEQDPPDNS